ncbi:MAG TPA: 6-phosphogluconolactonase [Planctomycetota bacterium]|nr:6-phosphogluconolactonase [Planctomycetota bacterium]
MPQFTARAGTARVVVHATPELSAAAAAEKFADAVLVTLRTKLACNVVFAGAQSQMPFHAALVQRTDINWSRINAFSVDDFYSPGMPAEYAVAAQPQRDLYAHVKLKSIHVLDYKAQDPYAECRRYAALLNKFPTDIACIGIGISGHLALNEPGDTKFNDPELVRLVVVPELSQQQLMTDPNFQALGVIPKKGLTMTIPAILRAQTILAIVPYALKAGILRTVLSCPVSEAVPASVLKTHPNTTLYLDNDSFANSRDLALSPA